MAMEPMMNEALKTVIMVTTVVEIGAGFCLAQLAASRPQSIHRGLRPLVRKWTSTTGDRMQLFLKGWGWLLVTVVSAALLVPLLPTYSAFRWIYLLRRATTPLSGRVEDFDVDD